MNSAAIGLTATLVGCPTLSLAPLPIVRMIAIGRPLRQWSSTSLGRRSDRLADPLGLEREPVELRLEGSERVGDRIGDGDRWRNGAALPYPLDPERI